MTAEDRNNKNKKNNDNPENWWQPAIMIFARLSGWLIAPVILGALFGKWLDSKFGTEPWLFIATVGLAFIISMVGLAINVVKEYKKIEDESAKKPNKT